MPSDKDIVIIKRRIASLQNIVEKAARMPCQHPTNCGDGLNSYDCVSCMAKAWLNRKKKAK